MLQALSSFHSSPLKVVSPGLPAAMESLAEHFTTTLADKYRMSCFIDKVRIGYVTCSSYTQYIAGID